MQTEGLLQLVAYPIKNQRNNSRSARHLSKREIISYSFMGKFSFCQPKKEEWRCTVMWLHAKEPISLKKLLLQTCCRPSIGRCRKKIGAAFSKTRNNSMELRTRSFPTGKPKSSGSPIDWKMEKKQTTPNHSNIVD